MAPDPMCFKYLVKEKDLKPRISSISKELVSKVMPASS